MEATSKGALSAVITGGASGMGFEVAKALSRRGGWHIHLLDLNEERGRDAASLLENATFHVVNVTNYDSLTNAFERIYDTEDRLDLVFANAGIIERFNFYESHPLGKPPPPPDQTVVDINLKSIINTAWLAQHYFRRSTISIDKKLIITASVGSLYPVRASPSYCASKHGALGFMRSIAPFYYTKVGVRVNAICPGSVRTDLLDKQVWDTFGPDVFVPLEKISQVVLMLIDGHDDAGSAVGSGQLLMGDAALGTTKLLGQAVEISGTNHYYRDQPIYCDSNMEACMESIQRETYA